MTKRKKKGPSNKKLSADTNADKTINADKLVGDATLKSSTVQTVKVEGQPVGFGEADDPPYLIEVRPTVQSGPTLPLKKYNLRMRGGVQVIGKTSDPFVATLPHQRYKCFYNSFTTGSTENVKHCQKCFCYVCDKPAAECKQWQNHCHAYKTDDWDMKRCIALNPLLKSIVERNQDIETTVYGEHKKVTDKLTRAWRLYEAGKLEEGVLKHQLDISWSKRYFEQCQTLARPLEGKINVIGLVVLGAMTEVWVTHSWRPPKDVSPESQWDERAETKYKTMCYNLNNLWLKFLAAAPSLADVMNKCMVKFSKVTKEKEIFKSQFYAIKVLASFLAQSKEAKNVKEAEKALCNYLENQNQFCERKCEHGIMMPFIKRIIQKIKPLENRTCFNFLQFQFYHGLTKKALQALLKKINTMEKPQTHFKCIFKRLYAIMEQDLPNRAKAYLKKLQNFLHLLIYIVIHGELTPSQTVDASEKIKQFIGKMTDKFKCITKDRKIKEENDYKWGICNYVTFSFHHLLKKKLFKIDNLENVIVSFYMTTLSMKRKTSRFQRKDKKYETRVWLTDSYDDFEKNFKRLTYLEHSKALFKNIETLYKQRKSKTTLTFKRKRKRPITVTKNKKTRKE